jgi:hypothetical protein
VSKSVNYYINIIKSIYKIKKMYIISIVRRKNMEKETILINFKVDRGLKDLLEEYSRKTRQTKSRFIRETLIKEIDRIKKEK